MTHIVHTMFRLTSKGRKAVAHVKELPVLGSETVKFSTFNRRQQALRLSAR